MPMTDACTDRRGFLGWTALAAGTVAAGDFLRLRAAAPTRRSS